MSLKLSSVYFGNIDYYSILNKKQEVEVDIYEHFQKQSYRNRSVIHGANGALNLIIPLAKRGNHTQMKDIKIDNSQHWQNLHWRSIESAYRSSPFFEFYQDDLKLFFEQEFTFLVDLNAKIQLKLIELLEIDVEVKVTDDYEAVEELDYRLAIHPKKPPTVFFKEKKYIQVFSQENGFLTNLSVLDLLFNEGPNAINFLG